jgi:hypothetical protein
MDFSDPDKLALLSPFELKDALMQRAAQSNQLMLNAGRGNPNFLATTPRHGFFQFGLFAMTEAERSYMYMQHVGGFPKREGIEARFELFAKQHESVPGVRFIEAAVSYVRDQMGLNAGDFIYEMCEAILGCNYPVPDRMLVMSEVIVGNYIHEEMIGTYPFVGNFDMYALEGGTAAMTYLFASLKANHVISAGDTIALGMPIFTPYIEIPQLSDYNLVLLSVDAPQSNKWQFTHEELDKLLDPKVKAFFLVNPSNPPSVKIDDETLHYIAEIVKKSPDLIILTDDVYATFADNFVSLLRHLPLQHHPGVFVLQILRRNRLAHGRGRDPRRQHHRRQDRRPAQGQARATESPLQLDHHGARKAQIHRPPGGRHPHSGAEPYRRLVDPRSGTNDKGFGTPHPSWRVSLANLNEYDYANIGKAIRKLSQEYYDRFVEATGAKVPTPAAKAAENAAANAGVKGAADETPKALAKPKRTKK